MSEGCSICADNGMRDCGARRLAFCCRMRVPASEANSIPLASCRNSGTVPTLHVRELQYLRPHLEPDPPIGSTSSQRSSSSNIHSPNGSGLLFTGSIGVGKTHLATSILRTLIVDKGAKGVFRDYRELLKEIQSSYNKQSQITELEILEPVLECEVLVLDELGAVKPTDWVWDTVSLVLNTRYNRKRTTIITTNFIDEPPPSLGQARVTPLKTQLQEETLGDRIGQRMLSRLAEMCVTVTMQGEDYRRTVGRARIG